MMFIITCLFYSNLNMNKTLPSQRCRASLWPRSVARGSAGRCRRPECGCTETRASTGGRRSGSCHHRRDRTTCNRRRRGSGECFLCVFVTCVCFAARLTSCRTLWKRRTPEPFYRRGPDGCVPLNSWCWSGELLVMTNKHKINDRLWHSCG